MSGPDKTKLYPNENIKTVCYISNLPERPNVEIGDYTYYSRFGSIDEMIPGAVVMGYPEILICIGRN